MAKLQKTREPIALRQKKLKDGRYSLYLDYYQPGDKNHSHKYEFLKLYLLPETSKENKAKNKETLLSAKTIHAQRLIDRANGKAGIKVRRGDTITLKDYIQYYADLKRKYGQSDANADLIEAMGKHLEAYNDSITLANVDKSFCLGFIDHLLDAKGRNAKKSHKPLSKRTVKIYFSLLSGALSYATSDELIVSNPIDKITKEERKQLKVDDSKRVYLTSEEVAKLIATPIYREIVKQAFMFACFCGLRIGDIISLTWGDIHKGEKGKMYIDTDMKKTQRYIYLPIPDTALKFLPERGEKGNSDIIFDVGTKRNVNTSLKKWAKNAGIEKNICFHVSRHTYATSLLTMGADLYTTSKLLGHKKISTTQIYGEIVNKKKQDAVDLLESFLEEDSEKSKD